MTILMNNIAPNQPLYLYQQPMFSLTVSIVLIIENGVLLIKDKDFYRFPGGIVKAGQESIQFSAVKYVKEQTGVMLKKDSLIPVDFRSEPERTLEKNVVDIGFVCLLDGTSVELLPKYKPNLDMDKLIESLQPYEFEWKEVNFEDKCLIDNLPLYMDHETLLERALTVAIMMKE